jgi:CDP-glucose 4,6-dehydratase
MMLAQELLAQRARFASSYNFGPSDDDVWPVERIASKLVGMWGKGASWIQDSIPSVHESNVLRLDASKARVELGWKPRLGIEEGLKWTMAWYRAWSQANNMAEFTRKQIAEYEELQVR